MKNFINYYYNLSIKDIYFDNKKYIFNDGNFTYILKVFNDVNFFSYYSDLDYELKKYENFFTVIKNVNNNYITLINNEPYILLRNSNVTNTTISIFDIKIDQFVTYNNKLTNLIRFPWFQLWENKVDYFETIFYSNQNKYKDIYALFQYFIGISENAILYLKNCDKEEKKDFADNMVISHNRMSVESEVYDYYDPTNIIFDHCSRDISEYVKSLFINESFDMMMFEDYLKSNKFSKYGLRMIYARIIFPSFFFDYVEDMLFHNDKSRLLELEAKIDYFEKFIKDISTFFKNTYDIPVIPWIIKGT